MNLDSFSFCLWINFEHGCCNSIVQWLGVHRVEGNSSSIDRISTSGCDGPSGPPINPVPPPVIHTQAGMTSIVTHPT